VSDSTGEHWNASLDKQRPRKKNEKTGTESKRAGLLRDLGETEGNPKELRKNQDP